MNKILFLLLPAFALAQITVGNPGGETHISSNTFWDGEVVMEGKIVVDAGVTLTIAPGTLVKCKSSANPEDATVLVVAKDGMINAAGTAANPIVFTAFDAVANPEVQGKWGGIVILGTAPIGEEGNNEKIEGIQGGASVTWNYYGGTDANDNSGTLQYVSIRHGGAIIAPGNELNGLTLGGVGAGTTIENIEIISNSDDGLECFGGNVDVTNLLVYNQGDDAVDIDEAYSGTVSNVVIHLGASSDTAFEIDGREDTTTPVDSSILTSISYTIDGVTVIGSGGASDGGGQLGDWKSDATGVNKNIVYTNFANDEAIKGIDADTYATGANNGTNLTFENVDYVGGNDEADILANTGAGPDAAWLEIVTALNTSNGATLQSFDDWTFYSTISGNMIDQVNNNTQTVGTAGGETHISQDTYWSGEVVMEGKVVVDAGVTLSIEAGTTVKCKSSANPEDATVLVVAKDGMINAAGTAANPIVFTAFDAVANPEVQGKWGGIVILGTAPIGEEGNNEKIEGIQGGASVTWNYYGGTDANDNSGTLQYVSIRHGGAIIAPGNELNGLTLGGVGAGTTIENIEIISNSDDGLECFGGNVDVTNLLVYNQGDDAVDIDEAYSGTVSNVVIHLGASSDTAFEIDGREDTTTPVDSSILTSISYTIDGVVVFGSGGASDGGGQLGDWKSDAIGLNKNISYYDFANDETIKGIDTDTYATGANNGTNLTFENVNYYGGNDEADILANTGAGPDAAWLTVSADKQHDLDILSRFNDWSYYSTFTNNKISASYGTTGGETHVSQDTTWAGEVVIEGKIVVDAGVTLTIAPGTLVKCKSSANPEDATVLVVAKDGMINAAGTAANPIVFTAFDAVANPEVQGKWGGIVILGTAPIGEEGNNEKIEGIQGGASVTWNYYGGTDANDNSGTLQYVSIRHGGAIIAPGNELNGLTLGGVGAGTTIENIEIISNSDDGLECFGGNVDVTNLLVYNQGDDAVDIDEAYSGTVSNVVIHLGASSDTAFEIDGREDTTTPVDSSILTSISYTIDGVTVIGSGGASDGGGQLGDWKSDATGVNKNIVYTNFANDEAIKGIDADTYATGANNGTNLTFENVDYVGGNDEADILANTGAGPDAAWLEVLGTQTPGTGAAFGNFAWTYWTTFSSFADGTLSVELVEENVVSFRLYPNPFNNEINVSSSKSINVISIYNTVGQQVLRKTNTNRVDVSSLKNGLYLVKVEAGDSIYVGKMLK